MAYDFIIDCEGTKVYGTVSPCCWMHKGYGLQYQLTLREKGCNGESEFIHEKSMDVADRKKGFITVVASAHAVTWLGEHGLKPLQDRLAHFDKVMADLKKESDKELKAIEKRDAAYKAKGYTHKVSAWIHPRSGDDYQVDAYVKGEPTKADIAELLKKSVVKNDYRVDPL